MRSRLREKWHWTVAASVLVFDTSTRYCCCSTLSTRTRLALAPTI